MKRRTFLKASAIAAMTSAAGSPLASQKASTWRGFNLVELYNENTFDKFYEKDFQLISEWGFNYLRVPINYRTYTNPENWEDINESFFNEYVDRCIELSQKYNIHVTLNLHRIPGYCINRRELEPHDLFDIKNIESREKALHAAIAHWTYISNRYKSVSSESLSFNPINEPPNFISENSLKIYFEVLSNLINAIRKESNSRQIIIDGLNAGARYYNPFGNTPNLIFSTRGYSPAQLTHYKADFVKQKTDYGSLAWPLHLTDGTTWDDDRLKLYYQDWIQASHAGTNVMVGEFGVFNTVNHTIVIAYLKSLLSLYKQQAWGWAMWNFKGPFGILDSNRTDVNYKKVDKYKLDSDLLELLQQYL
jgi:endoglucanase